MTTLTAPNTYRIELPVFEGPFDLLLFFIERDELDIHDIPISRITKDFLTYVHQMETLNIEIASEFILVASTLMRIKVKMLLPRPVLDEAGNEQDPRKELVNRLIEYKRYKAVQEDIAQMEQAASERFKRSFAKKEEKLFLESEFPEEELLGIDLYTIMRTFKRIWEKHNDQLEKPKHVIRKYPFTIEQVKATILNKLQETPRIDFVSFVLDQPSKMYCVFSFLSALEMAQVQKIKLIIGEGFNNFWLCSHDYKKPA
ncbi:MAG TPA: chromosome segregation protein ScpA [Bacteroidetes bacterium]|nr:chromosome segregation protein ScpA [Bacteroidota bacterium]